MFPNLTIPLQSDPNMKCNFTQDIASHLNAINIAIDGYFPGIKERHNFLWISKPFSVKENFICNDDMAAKIEFLRLRKDSSLKTDFAGEDIRNFWAGFQNEYPILLKKALRFLFNFLQLIAVKWGFLQWCL